MNKHMLLLSLAVLTCLLLAVCATAHAAKFCPGCGKEVGPDWKFCENCGARLVAGSTGRKPWEREGTKAREEITGPDGGLMVWVPPGEFMMGSEDADDDVKPVHKVRITKGFWLGKHEVTNAQYRAFCEATGKAFPEKNDQGDDHPVRYASWQDFKAYCDHYGLALPTEAQWEYAARGPEGRVYPWGNGWDSKKCCNRDNRGPDGTTFPVGSFPDGASWCGALNMAGNVREWCSDWYDYSYYANSPDTDPAGPATGRTRLTRGGMWSSYGNFCWSVSRCGWLLPGITYDEMGFRCVRTP